MRSLDRPRYPRPRASKYVPIALEIRPIDDGRISSAQMVIPNLYIITLVSDVSPRHQPDNAREFEQS